MIDARSTSALVIYINPQPRHLPPYPCISVNWVSFFRCEMLDIEYMWHQLFNRRNSYIAVSTTVDFLYRQILIWLLLLPVYVVSLLPAAAEPVFNLLSCQFWGFFASRGRLVWRIKVGPEGPLSYAKFHGDRSLFRPPLKKMANFQILSPHRGDSFARFWWNLRRLCRHSFYISVYNLMHFGL